MAELWKGVQPMMTITITHFEFIYLILTVVLIYVTFKSNNKHKK